MPPFIKYFVREALVRKFADDWLWTNCPYFFDLACAECLVALDGVAEEW